MIRFRKNIQQNLCGCDQGRSFSNLVFRIRFRLKVILVSLLSLVYNDHMSRSYVFDTLMEPAFWFVDSFAKVLGPLFVVGVVILKTSVVVIAYVVGLPYYWEHKVRFEWFIDQRICNICWSYLNVFVTLAFKMFIFQTEIKAAKTSLVNKTNEGVRV